MTFCYLWNIINSFTRLLFTYELSPIHSFTRLFVTYEISPIHSTLFVIWSYIYMSGRDWLWFWRGVGWGNKLQKQSLLLNKKSYSLNICIYMTAICKHKYFRYSQILLLGANFFVYTTAHKTKNKQIGPKYILNNKSVYTLFLSGSIAAPQARLYKTPVLRKSASQNTPARTYL